MAVEVYELSIMNVSPGFFPSAVFKLLPHVKEFKYLKVLFTSEGIIGCEIKWRNGTVDLFQFAA